MSKITAERLRELLDYDQETGIMTWKSPIARNRKPGDVAGYTTKRGYRVINVLGERHLAHRLAWFHHYGAWPERELDHKNVNGLDCRISNLREASRQENLANTRRSKANNSGHKGVCWDASRSKWMAYIGGRGSRQYLGRYHSRADAEAAYEKAARGTYGEFARVE